jgi:LmbE family N-acetylglucosaminyl deacetylase
LGGSAPAEEIEAMHRLSILPARPGPKRVLALGAHSDDIEIGCGGTLLRLADEHPDLDVTWVVFCSSAERRQEAESSARAFLSSVRTSRVIVKAYRDGFLPYAGKSVKEDFEALKPVVAPDLILTHYRDDRHQDHRAVSDLTWNTWRNHLVLEYEIPKWDGDLGVPNVFCPLPAATMERKVELLMKAFPSQAAKAWFTPDLFRSLARIRGMECVATDGYAESFYCRKATF